MTMTNSLQRYVIPLPIKIDAKCSANSWRSRYYPCDAIVVDTTLDYSKCDLIFENESP